MPFEQETMTENTHLSKAEMTIALSVRERWIHETFHAGDDCDENGIKEGIAWLYHIKKRKQPKVLIEDSPFAVRNKLHQVIYKLHHMMELSELEMYKRYSLYAQACNDSIWPNMKLQLLDLLSPFLRKKHSEAWQLHDNTYYFDYLNKVVNLNALDITAEKFRRNFSLRPDSSNSDESLLSMFPQIICYDFLRETAVLSSTELDMFIKFLRSGCFMTALSNDYAIVIRRPTFTRFNHSMFLHSEDGSAVQWRDGRQSYYLNGVSVSEEVVLTPAGQLDPRLALETSNAEERMEIVKKVGIYKLISAFKGRLIDAWNGYELVQLSIPDMQIVPLYLKMTNPSTGDIHFEGVPPDITTCGEALSWRVGGLDWNPQQLT